MLSLLPLDAFLFRALAAGVGVALIAGPLGCFVIWRRMAYFGDALSHSALLGIALGVLTGLQSQLAVILVCLLFALCFVALRERRVLAEDTLLGILAHATLAFGMVTIALFQDRLRIDLFSYLFGDILSVTRMDLYWIYGGGAVAAALLAWLWQPLLRMTLHEDLARAEGIRTVPVQLGFMLLMALVTAITMQVAGVLLITSLLILPAAAARPFARSPEQMALLAACIGAGAVVLGLLASVRWDTPSGPSIVVAATVIFAAGLAVKWRTL